MTKQIIKLGLVIISTFIAIQGFGSNPVKAASSSSQIYSIDQLTVNIKVNKDSTVDISEKLNYNFVSGDFHGMYREITTTNQANLKRCQQDATLQCGGFSLLKINKVLVDDQEVPKGRYETLNTSTSDEDRLRVQYQFDNAPVSLSNVKHTFQVDYTVWGSIGLFQDYALFYWNAIFPDRVSTIPSTTVTVEYPGSVAKDSNSRKVLTDSFVRYTETNPSNTKVNYSVTSIPSYSDFTLMQKIPLAQLSVPGNLQLNLNPSGQKLNFSGFELVDVPADKLIVGMPVGTYNMKFFLDDRYESLEKQLVIQSGKTTNLTVDLPLTPLGQLLNILLAIGNVCGCLFIFVGIGGIYFIWRAKGRDKGLAKVIIPEYSPPDKIRPYLLGSLKDEKVDQADITSTLIDLACRGYLKIIEEETGTIFKTKSYTLEKIKEFEGLTDSESLIMAAVFGATDSVNLDTLKNSFYLQVPGIKTSIYQELVSRGYFTSSPDSVRKKWYGVGALFLILGTGLGCFLMMLGVLTLLPSVFIVGIVAIVAAGYMPAKTELGGKTLSQVLGFKMYLETAEKYTLQKLTPATFEAYLPYAMVFGIENEWADKFKDIYKTPPDWFVSSNPSAFDIWMLSSSMRNFSNTSASVFTSVPQSSSSGSSFGGGWSGGGGFGGGFGGGGGGGGGGGAW